ncbi:MAG: hypothetical protein ABSF98_03555 [Bryobacteraceae bacterium]
MPKLFRPGVSGRHMGRVTLRRCALSLALASGLFAADSTNPALAVQIASEAAPAGGWTEVKVFLSTPAHIASGSISMDLDPAVFGDIGSVAVFSPSGDAMGYANVTHQHVDAHFYSPSTWLGALPDVPVFAVWVPVLAGATPGQRTTVTLNPSGSQLFDPLGDEYAMTVQPGTFTVGGTLSVEDTVPGGGIVTATALIPSAPIRIDGTGFDRGTTVSIDGVSVSSVELVSPQQVNVTLNAPAELTGKHFHIANSAGEQVDYFPAFPSAPSAPPAGLANNAPGVYPLVPLASCTNVYSLSSTGLGARVQLALLNPNPLPVDVAFLEYLFTDPEPHGSSVLQTITIPAGTLYFLDTGSLGLAWEQSELFVSASAPLRMLEYEYPFPPWFDATIADIPTAIASPPPITLLAAPAFVSLNWQPGSLAPPAQTLAIPMGFQVSMPPDLAKWLSVAPMQSALAGTLSMAVIPGASLSPGMYNGTFTITPVLSGPLASLSVEASTIEFSLTVSAGPPGNASEWPPAISFSLVQGAPAATGTLPLAGPGPPAPFTASASTSTGGNWLSVTPSSGTAPATLSVTANPAGLSPTNYFGTITVQGSTNTLSIPVGLYVSPATAPLYSGPLIVSPPLPFTVYSGVTQSQELGWMPNVPATVSVTTQSGGNWLTATLQPGAQAELMASAVGLAPGTYQATVTVASVNNGTAQSVVTLTVVPLPGPPTPLNVTPSRVSLSDQVGSQTLTLDSGATPVPFTVQISTPGGDFEIQLAVHGTFDGYGNVLTPATVVVSAYAQEPGTHAGSIVIASPTGSVTVPVTLTTAGTANPGPGIAAAWAPVMATVASAADHTSGGLSPGEIAMVLGMGIGPAPTNIQIDASGKVATSLNGTQVLINSVPAPLLYADGNLINFIVPYEIPTGEFATVQVIANGQQAAIWGVPAVPAAPGIFTLTETGLGQAAVLNTDNSVNGAANPAARGGAIQIFATGEGQTTPAGITGEITQMDLKKPVLPVQVMIGGIKAQLNYSGSAPDAVAGLLQVNAVVPANVTPGPAVPIVLIVGGVKSPDGVTIAVQ